jgi:hypothetical protein
MFNSQSFVINIVMKLFVCLTVFCAFCTVGIIVYCRAKSRVAFYSGLIAFCNNLLTEISFTHTPAAQVIDRYIDTYPKELRIPLSAYRKLLADKTDISREKCLDITCEPQTADFLYNLGRSGVNEEQDKITNAVQLFTASQNSAQTYLKTNALITLKIMVLTGIAAVILLL